MVWAVYLALALYRAVRGLFPEKPVFRLGRR
jgi:hypothetical protein